MSCRRAYEIDIAAYLADPRAADFAEFRAHYPGCTACAAELGAWTELEARLGAGAPGHPEPALLLRYEDAREALDAGMRGRLEAHLARCPACRDELAGLRTLQPTLLAAQPAPRRPAGRASIAAALRRLLWQPAFAYALAFALAAPLLYLQVTRERLDLLGPEAATRGAPPLTSPPAALGAEVPRPSPSAAPPPPAPRKGEEAASPPARPAPAPEPKPALLDTAGAAAPRVPRAEPAPEGPAPAKESERPQPPMARVAPSPDVAPGTERESASSLQQLRALGYVTEGSRPDAPAGASGTEPTRLPLRPDGRGGHLLSVPLDREAGPIEVRIDSPDGTRSLGQRFPAGTASAELWLPPGWIEGGTYRVTVRSERRERGYVTGR